jgi:hypothetical protein
MTGKYANQERLDAYQHYVQTYAPFTAQTPAGSVIFTGTGSAVATPAEQRMIAEFAQLAALEAVGGQSGATHGVAIGWHREGGIAGFCDDVVVTVVGKAYATSCKGGTPKPLGTTWLSADEVKQMFDWVDRLKSFSIDQTDPAQADAMTIRMVFAGNGSAEPTDADKQAIQNFAQQQLIEIMK